MSYGQSHARGLDLRIDSSVRTAGTAILILLAVASIAALVQQFAAPLVLGAALVVAVAAVMLLRPELATIVTVFLLYVNFPAMLTKQFGMPHVVAGAFILLLAFPIIHTLVVRRESLKADRTFYVMLAFLTALLISSFKAVDSKIAAKYILEYILEGLLLYWLFINVLRGMTTLRRVIWTLLAAGAFLSSVSLYQTVTGSFDNDFKGLAYRHVEVAPQDQDDEAPLKRQNEKYRAAGPVGEPNRFAQILVVLVPLAVFMYRTSRSRAARMWATGLGGLVLVGVPLTLSRGGFIAVVVLIGLMMGLKWIRSSRVLVCALIVAIMVPAIPVLNTRLASITNARALVGGDRTAAAQQADGAILGRATLMLSALHVFMDHPVVGVGPGQYPPFYSVEYVNLTGIKFRDMADRNWRAHSLYLELAAELGVIGLVLFLAAIGVVVLGLWRARQYWLSRDREYADLATAFWLSLVIWLWSGIIQHLAYQPYYWFLLATASAALHILYHTRPPQETGLATVPAEPPGSTLQLHLASSSPGTDA
jgi:putative inorganic carbon (hco3(-)) transporter